MSVKVVEIVCREVIYVISNLPFSRLHPRSLDLLALLCQRGPYSNVPAQTVFGQTDKLGDLVNRRAIIIDAVALTINV